jgi:hypothetical protein
METAANCPVPAANGRTAEGTNPARLLSALGEDLEPAWPVVEFMGHTRRIPFRANRCLAGAERSDRSTSRSGFPRAVCSCDARFGGTRWKVWFGAATVFRSTRFDSQVYLDRPAAGLINARAAHRSPERVSQVRILPGRRL